MAGNINGLPYPTGTDFLVDGDNAIRALAEAADARVPFRIALGTFQSGAQINTGATQDHTIQFPAGRFTQAPAVFASSANGRLTVGIAQVATTQAVFSLCNWSTGNCPPNQAVRYVAIQMLPTGAYG